MNTASRRRVSGAGRGDRQRLARLLAEALRVRRMNQSTLAKHLGVTQGTVSTWTRATAVPQDLQTVFKAEQILDLPPGYLSRPLGFMPDGAKIEPLPVEAAINACPYLEPRMKVILLATYRTMVEQRRRSRPADAKSPRDPSGVMLSPPLAGGVVAFVYPL